MDLPNLTELLGKATERPWAIESGLMDRNERYIVVEDTNQVLGELFENKTANARLLVLAANNFETIIQELAFCERAIRQLEYPASADRIEALLAKIEREAGER